MLATHVENIDGRLLRVARQGCGPPVLLLHGYPDNLQIWCRLAPLLATRFDVIAFDWPGLGYSEPWPGGTTPAHQAQRLNRLLAHWQIERAHVLGADMGGQPALVFAAHYPERAGRVIVMNSLLYGDAQTSWEIRILRQFGRNRSILGRLPWLVFRHAERTFLPSDIRLAPDLRADMWNSFRRVEVRKFLVRLCAGYQGRLAALPAEYRKIHSPTLALWSGADRHFPPVHAERLCADVSGAEMMVVPGARHWMMWDRADEIARHAGAFLPRGMPD